jgi:TonB family protein
MQYKILKVATAILLLLSASMAPAQTVSNKFMKTYRAYNSAYQQGDLQRAEDLAKKTLEMGVKELGPDHEKIPVLLINLGHVEMLLGHNDAAEKYLLEARKKIKPDQKDAPSSLLTIHEDMARIYSDNKDLDKAHKELDQAIALRTKDKGANDPVVADLLGMQAQLYIAQKKYDTADSLIARGLKIVETKYGKNDNRVAGYLTMQGDVAEFRNNLKKAEGLYLRAMAILKKNLVSDDPSILHMHKKLADLYIAMGSDKFASHADAYVTQAELREGAALPIFVIKPKLPAGKKIDLGSVLLNMTVTDKGRVKDLKVIEADVPRSVIQATVRAASQWRFKPKIEKGKRLPQANTRARVVFRGGKVEVHLGEMKVTG